MKCSRSAAMAAIAAVAVAGLGAGAAITACGSAGQPPAASTTGGAAYSYYQSMMRRLDPGSSGSMMGGTSRGSMMGGLSRGAMIGGAGYRWMMGGLAAPAWMRGHALPGFMTGGSGDAGEIMGAQFANAPGARVTLAQATRLGNQVPAGATASPAQHRITLPGASIRLVVLAGPGQTYRIAGLLNPAIVVNARAHVSIEVINVGPGTANGLVITAAHARSSPMPMMTARPAFPGSALWFLGNPTSAGLHTATLSFTASTPGTYQYLCPVPGHAQEGMAGAFIINAGA
jgi:FtsP/CotA-like multicopper oxidase with cupredoxin domain